MLLLHGGTEHSREPVHAWTGPVLRMLPIGRAIRRRSPGVAISSLRFRHRGWNGASADPVTDVESAIGRLHELQPDLPVILVGHSMGGRAAIRAAGESPVAGVVALAPWLPLGEPVEQLAGTDLVILHGTNDHRTSPLASERFAREARPVARSVEYVTIPGGDHSMLRHARTWHRLTADAVARIAAGRGTRSAER